MGEYYIGLSISDLQQWLADDAISISVSRVFHSRVNLDDQVGEAYFDGLFGVLPPFALDDPAGVLIAQITGPATWGVDDEPTICNLHLNVVKRFIPLLSDARKVLAINWSETICLEEAIFEKRFLRFRLRRKKVRAIEAGLKFVSIFINHGDIKFDVSDEYKSSLTRALMIADQLRSDEINEVLGKYAEKYKETWIDRLFGYTRHKRFDRAEDIKSFFDVGVILSETGATKSLIDDFRDICVRINRSGEPSLAEICSDQELLKFSVNFDISGMDSSQISVVTLGLFLRWKQRFHDDRSAVNAGAIYDDVCSIAEKVDVHVVSSALWIMGAYLGMEHVSPLHRFFNQSNYSALVFHSVESSFFPVPAWSKYKKEAFERKSSSDVEVAGSQISRDHNISELYDTTCDEKSESVMVDNRNSEESNEGSASINLKYFKLFEAEASKFSNAPEIKKDKVIGFANPVGSDVSKELDNIPYKSVGKSPNDAASKPEVGIARETRGRNNGAEKYDEKVKTDKERASEAQRNTSSGKAVSKADSAPWQGEFPLEDNDGL